MNVVGPDGKAVWVDDADLQKASNAGYRAATPEEVAKAKAQQEAADHPVQAAAEGAARTATFGLSDQAITGYYKGGGEDPSQVRARKEANPVASTGGELAGFLAPGPKFGAMGRVAGGLAEGGLRGLGTAISEDAMGDPKLAGEHYAAGMLGGALAGAGTNVVFGKAGDLAKSALVKAFGGKALTQHLGEMAENQVMRSVMNPSDLGKKSLRGRVNDVGRFALDEGFTKGGASFATASERAAARADQAWQGMEGALTEADKVAKFDAKALVPRLQKAVDALDNNPAMTEVQSGLKNFIAKVADPETGPTTFRKAWETTSSMLKQAKNHSLTPTTLKDELFRMRKEIQDEIAAQMPSDLASTFKKASDEYSHSATFRDLALKKADKAEGGGLGLMDMVAGAGAFAHAGPAGLAAPFATKAIRERGGFVVGSALDAMSQSKVLERIANGFAKTVKNKLETIPTFGGAFRATLETASAKGAMALLETHSQLSHDPEYMASVGLEHEDPSTVSGYADKAHRLGQMYNAVDAGGEEVEKSIRRVLGEQGGAAPKVKKFEPTPEKFAEITAKLKALTGENDEINRRLGETAPTTAGLAAGGTAAGAQYLLDTAPKNPHEGLPPALQRPWAPAKDDLRAWFRRVEAVADPRSILDNMRTGTVTPEAMESVQQVYPAILQDMKDRMMSRLSQWQEPLDRKRRSQIGVLLGGTEDRKVAQLIQAAHTRMSQPVQGQGPDGREKIDVEKSMMTQAQRLESKQGPA